MPRDRLEDYYQNYRFHLIDITVVTDFTSLVSNSLSKSSIVSGQDVTPFALSPILGFNSITAPSLEVNTHEIEVGNAPYSVTFSESAETGNITLSRGVHIGDQSFFDWIKKAVMNYGVFRRNLLLIQFHTYPGEGAPGIGDFLKHIGIALAAETGGAASTATNIAQNAFSSGVPAKSRLWRLNKCIPVSYTSGQDLDAESGDITVADLELNIKYFEEFSFGTSPALKSGWNAVTGG